MIVATLSHPCVFSPFIFPNATAGTWTKTYDLDRLANDPDPEVRAEVIRAIGGSLARVDQNDNKRDYNPAVDLLIKMAKPSLSEPTAKSTHSGKTKFSPKNWKHWLLILKVTLGFMSGISKPEKQHPSMLIACFLQPA